MALGVVGLSLHDALSLTPDEFNAVYEEWNMLETARYRAGWEQARFMAHCALLPNAKRGFKPTDLVRFDWDKDTMADNPAASLDDFERMRERFGG